MEFRGRCPTIREVASISDAHWLTVPNIGPTTLVELRSIALQSPNGEEHQHTASMQDNELISRLNRLQRDLAAVADEIRSRIGSGSSYKRGFRKQE